MRKDRSRFTHLLHLNDISPNRWLNVTLTEFIFGYVYCGMMFITVETTTINNLFLSLRVR